MAHLLLVEDDADVRFIMEHVLIDVGHRVDAVPTVREALRSLQHNVYDLVVADGVLPDGTGLAVADEAAERDTQTIIVTGYAFTLPADIRRYEILLKPVRPRELIDAVERKLQMI